MGQKNFKDEMLEDAAEKLLEAVNCFSLDGKAFVDTILNGHRSLQQGVMRVVYQLIVAWSEEETWDLRNQATIEACQKIVKTFDGAKKINLPFV